MRGIAVSTTMARELNLHVFDALGSGRALGELLEHAGATVPDADRSWPPWEKANDRATVGCHWPASVTTY